MSKFKVGDRVRCVETDETHLSDNIEYTISEIKDSFIKLQGIPSAGFYQRRFEKVPEEPRFKVGSKAWSPNYGWGEVRKQECSEYPIRVRFDSGRDVEYTKDGKVSDLSILPTLFLSEVSALDWPNPPAKVDPSTLVVGQDLEVKLSSDGVWILTKFAMLKDGFVWVFSHNNDSKSAEIMYKTEDFRLPVAQKGV